MLLQIRGLYTVEKVIRYFNEHAGAGHSVPVPSVLSTWLV